MAKEENKKEKKEETKVKEKDNKEKDIKKTDTSKKSESKTHTEGRTTKKSSKKLREWYKKRNRLVEVIIICILVVILFILACNKTFLRTEYTKKVDNSTITISLPRFTYYVSSDDDTIVFKTLRKSTNTREFFEEFLENGSFDYYYCNVDDTQPYYYSPSGKYFITSIEVTKSFAMKTITIHYSTDDYDNFCNNINSETEEEDEL